ncbi:MAG: hypothetical protein AAGF76_11015 [Pseudomonadota bacterium]
MKPAADLGEKEAITLACARLGPKASVRRFTHGSQHFVWEATAPGHSPEVLRLTRASDRALAAAALGWSARLRPLGLPLPRVLAADIRPHKPFAWIALERLPGSDLGDEIAALPRERLDDLAAVLVEHQNRLDALPDGAGYGFALSEQGPFRQAHWREVVEAELTRARQRIHAGRAVDEALVERAARAVSLARDTLLLPPRPFLHDITTKNVITVNGHLSGIVDVDELCYGDVFYLPGLIGAILTAYDLPEDYLDAWLWHLGADAAARRRVALYRSVHALGLLSEIGQRFNRETPVPRGGPLQERLEAYLARALPG